MNLDNDYGNTNIINTANEEGLRERVRMKNGRTKNTAGAVKAEIKITNGKMNNYMLKVANDNVNDGAYWREAGSNYAKMNKETLNFKDYPKKERNVFVFFVNYRIEKERAVDRGTLRVSKEKTREASILSDSVMENSDNKAKRRFEMALVLNASMKLNGEIITFSAAERMEVECKSPSDSNIKNHWKKIDMLPGRKPGQHWRVSLVIIKKFTNLTLGYSPPPRGGTRVPRRVPRETRLREQTIM